MGILTKLSRYIEICSLIKSAFYKVLATQFLEPSSDCKSFELLQKFSIRQMRPTFCYCPTLGALARLANLDMFEPYR